MFYEYILYLKNESLIEFIIQVILFYNLIQILKQNNFYYLLAYFLNFIVYLGLYLIIFDLDIICAILWIVYGGVILIFFIYSLLWFENIKNINYFSKYKIIYYLFNFFILFSYFLLNIKTIEYSINITKYNTFNYRDFYAFLNLDTYEELDNLGWGLIYYSTFFFLIISYMLFLACCCSVVIIINSKKIKYTYINIYYLFIKKNINLFSFNIYKYQHFFTQEYENINQIHSLNKNFKINQNFHKIKDFNRRV